MRRAAPYLYVAPVLVLMGVFIYRPLAYSIQLSLLDWNFISPTRTFVGVDNYIDLASDDDFLRPLVTTGTYVLLLVPILVVVPLAIAVLLWPTRGSRAQPIYRAVLFSPTVVAVTAAAVVWLWIFDPLQGVLVEGLVTIGVDRSNVLQDPTLAFLAVVWVSAWKAFGFNLLLFIAALEAVPRNLVEAAQVDGARGWAQFRFVRLPLITPTLFFVVVTTIIFISDEVFQVIQVLTQGGPFGETENLLYALYRRGFIEFDVGAGSAIAVVASALVVSVTWLQFRYVDKRVHYG